VHPILKYIVFVVLTRLPDIITESPREEKEAALTQHPHMTAETTYLSL